MKQLKLTKHQFQEIVDVYDINMEEMEFFLNIETGEMVTLRTFDRDEEEEEMSEIIEELFNEVYFQIPERDSNEGYEDMLEFTATIADQKLKTALMQVLSGGNRIFRRFKDTLSSDRDQLERYYLFIEEQNRKRVVEWLQSINVELILLDK